MIVSVQEIRLLQEVLLSLTNISTAVMQTLIVLSNGQIHEATSSEIFEKEINQLKGSIQAANGLVAFYDQRLHEERENGALMRHMAEATVLTDSIRAIRQVDTISVPVLSRRNTVHGAICSKFLSLVRKTSGGDRGTALRKVNSRRTQKAPAAISLETQDSET